MIFKKKTSFYFLTIINLLLFSHSQAAPFESSEKIKIEIENFIQNSHLDSKYPIDIDPIKISPKLKVKQCHSPLNINYANPSKRFGHTLVKVKCTKPAFWRMNVPVTINKYDDVLWLINPVAKGQNIDESDVTTKKMNISKLFKGYFIHFDQLKALQTRRPLKANILLSPNQFQARYLVKSGQQVTVVLKTKHLNIKTSGTALQSASKGQLVKVRNNSSLKILSGIVSDEGTIQVHL